MTSSSFLLLGEGDFTYSLDFCRFIVASSCATTIPDADDEVAGAIRPKSATAPDGLGSIISIACTGVDTLQELREKYKDIDFVLRNIRKCNNMHSRVRLETSIVHGINAVEARCNDADDNDRLQSFDHVIFNHPHLGTEDAQLHTRFLHHLFHACVNRWMKPRTGLLHLTLVNGQCSRWKCIEGATKHGLVLRRRKTFCPPPPPLNKNIDSESTNVVGKSYYNLRRHQSGRSFANRRAMQSTDGANLNNDSETLVFGRACDDCRTDDIVMSLLPWELISRYTANCSTNLDANNALASTGHLSLFPCKYCSRSFEEYRSLKNHLLSLHPTCDEVRTWNIEKCEKRNKRRKISSEGNKYVENAIDDLKENGMQQSDDNVALCDSNDDEIHGPPWICSVCDSKRLSTLQRNFPHKEALLAHQRAKHFGSHLNIKPDWHRDDHVENSSTDENDANGKLCGDKGILRSCPICDKHFLSEEEESLHAIEFLPKFSVLAMETAQQFASEDTLQSKISCPGNACAYCSKPFGGVRARRQHENFCSFRPQEGA